MRSANLTQNEILEAEKAASDRRDHRNAGFKLMKDRDLGAVTLSNGKRLLWHTPKPDPGTLPNFYVYPPEVPEGHVILDGKLYDAEELKKWLRWA